MKRTLRRRPYRNDGRTSFPDRGRPGVYLIHDGSGRIVYVGFGAADVYKPLYRHFQQWNDRTRQRSTFDRDEHTVRVIYVSTAGRARTLERALILKHRPKANLDKLDGYTLTPRLAEIAQAAEEAPF